MTLDNLVKVTTILPNQGDVVAAAREGRSKVLGDRKPGWARSIVRSTK
jgi:2-iminobutanoate/2-iminopropanoate deaminase